MPSEVWRAVQKIFAYHELKHSTLLTLVMQMKHEKELLSPATIFPVIQFKRGISDMICSIQKSYEEYD